MYTNEVVLVHIPEAVNKMMTKMESTEIEKRVVAYAEAIMDHFCEQGKIDYYDLIEDNQDKDFSKPVVFANQNWDLFTSYLNVCDSEQKGEAKCTLEDLIEQTGTTDLVQILDKLLLSNNRNASPNEVDEDTWKRDYRNRGARELKQLARFIQGEFMFDSGFYDSYRRTALVPFYEKLKENIEEWALVVFNCHW